MKRLNSNLKWAILALFIGVLLLNYLSSAGIIFPNTQAEISNKYLNLFAPAGFTFSIWGLIYLGMAVSISIGFTEKNASQLGAHYRQVIQPLYIEWMLYNILWIITWSYDLILVSLIAILLYTRTMTKIMKVISGTPALRQSPWKLKYPVGLHTGWLYVASMANLTTYTVSVGLDGLGTFSIWWTIIVMIVVVLILAFLYGKFGNEAIMLPGIWAIIGIAVKHTPNGTFEYANTVVFVAAIVVGIIAVGLFTHFFRLQKDQA